MNTTTLNTTQQLAKDVVYDAHNASEYVWLKLLYERGHDYVEAARWSTRTPGIDPAQTLGRVLIEERNDGRSRALLDTGDALIYIDANDILASIGIRIACSRDATHVAKDLKERLQTLFPKPDNTGETVPALFRYKCDYGNAATSRSLTTKPWSDIETNYAASTKTQLDALLSTWTPGAGGRLLLWHGEPGTGKTWALRALAHAWRDWCRLELITDPEQLLGETEYLMSVITEPDEAERWRLLVLEDTGELLQADAKQHEGQRLSRLLNIADGLVGQDLRVLVLVTSNDDLRSVHPAMARPGRCASAIEFAPLSTVEANAWLIARDVTTRVNEPTTLATLFALAEGRTLGPPRRRAGFLAE